MLKNKLLIIKSLIKREEIGIKKAWNLFLKYAPPNKAMAPIGVKFGICGIQLLDDLGLITKSCSRFPSIIGSLFYSSGLSKIFPSSELINPTII